MKKVLLFIAVVLLGVTAMAQTADNDSTARDSRQTDYEWISDGNSVYIPYSNANIGIRTDYPQEALHVNGFICGDGGHRALRVRTECGTTTIGADSWAYSHFNTDRPRFYFYKPIMVQDGCISSSSQTNLKLQTFNYNGSSLDPITRMTILYSNGNVGIGTMTPDNKLQVNGGLKIGQGNTATERNTNVLYFGDEDYVKIGEFDADDALSFDADKFCFHNGNVGIQTTTPSYALDVNGKMFLRSLNQDGNDWYQSYFYWNAHCLVMGTPPGHVAHNSLDLKPGGSSDPQPLFSRVRMYTATGTNTQIQKIELCTENNCWFNNTGNFGIGTSAPTHKLDVRGTIRANEVLVNIPSGADFVFDNNYHLMPLDELSEYVQQNKHLPEVKSAAEMEQDGVTMGEMQIKLLQKVEELTLYILQQQATIENLKQQVEELKTK